MASINAATAGGGGVITTSDATGNLNIQSGGSTVVAVTSAGVAVTGTLAATGAVSGTTGTFTGAVSGTTGTFTGTGKFATTIGVGNATPSASGSGITFPATQSASSDANTLDDYEEGTWTATLTATTTPPTTPITSTGAYTKIGGLVTVTCNFIGVNTTGAVGDIIITGLPFTVGSYDYHGTVGQNSLGVVVLMCTAASGSTTLRIRDAATTVYTPMVAGAAKYLIATITYTV